MYGGGFVCHDMCVDIFVQLVLFYLGMAPVIELRFLGLQGK